MQIAISIMSSSVGAKLLFIIWLAALLITLTIFLLVLFKKNYKRGKKIMVPLAILSCLILTTSLAAAPDLLSANAMVNIIPRDITLKQTNNNSIDIKWKTLVPYIEFITFRGETQNERVVLDVNRLKPVVNHEVKISNLHKNTTYFFSIHYGNKSMSTSSNKPLEFSLL